MTAMQAPRRAIVGWVLFDWAQQPYFTLITTFVYAPYFASAIAPDPARGQALWGFSAASAGLAIALFSPVLGAIADAAGRSIGGRTRPGYLCDPGGRGRIHRCVQQCHDARPGAAGTARPALGHRL